MYFYAMSDTPARELGHVAERQIASRLEISPPLAGRKNGAWLSFATRQGQQMRVEDRHFVCQHCSSKAQAWSRKFPISTSIEYIVTRSSRGIEALGAIELHGATDEQQQMFYTALYHTMLMPVDRTGENPLWQSNEPSYDDFYAIWDTFRTSGPLLTLIAPERRERHCAGTGRHLPPRGAGCRMRAVEILPAARRAAAMLSLPLPTLM